MILNLEAMVESREKPVPRFQYADAECGFGILPGFFLLFVTAHGLREIPEFAVLRQRLLQKRQPKLCSTRLLAEVGDALGE